MTHLPLQSLVEYAVRNLCCCVYMSFHIVSFNNLEIYRSRDKQSENTTVRRTKIPVNGTGILLYISVQNWFLKIILVVVVVVVVVDWLLHVTINDISVICVTAYRCAGGLKKKLDLPSGSQRHRLRSIVFFSTADKKGDVNSTRMWRHLHFYQMTHTYQYWY